MLEFAGTPPLVLGANPIEAPIAWIVGSIASYLGGLDIKGALADPLGMLVPLNADPLTAAAQSPLARVTPYCGSRGSCDFGKIASSIRAIGYMLLAIVLVVRMLKLAATGRTRSPEHVLFDLVPKLMLGIGLIQYFDRVLDDFSRLSMAAAFVLEKAMVHPISLDLKDIFAVFPTQGLGVLLLPTLYVLVFYLLLLVVTSRLVLLLGAMISPLGIPIALAGDGGGLAGTWVRMIVSSLLVPVLAGIGTAGSLALAWLVHQVTGNGPLLGSYLGALTGECGLLFTAFVTTAMFKDVVKQGIGGVRGSLEASHMGSVARAPGEALATSRRGGEAAAGVAMAAAGVPMGAALTARALKNGRPGPEPEAGDEGAPPPVPPLPGGPGLSGAGSPRPLPAPDQTADGPQLRLPAPGPDVPPNEARIVRRRVEGGQVIEDIEHQRVVHFARYLSSPGGDLDVDPELGLAQEV